MENSKSTKRALLTSALTILACVAMLIGTTFAWFTDTASTAVNKIVSGKLDVELLDENGTPLASDYTLKWKTQDTGTVLWEPNCTYDLEPFQIKNAGTLALKYKVILRATDITVKDGKSLLDVIDWTLKLGEDVLDVTSEQIQADLGGGIAILTDRPLLPGKIEKISVTGHMKAEAGNDYQNLSIDGFGVTVVAAQYTYEFDSSSNEYDKDATYPVASNVDLSDALREAADGSTVVIASGAYALPGASTTVLTGVTISGAGADKTVLTTDSKNYEFTGENVTIQDVTIDGRKVSSVDNNGAIKITGSNAVLDNVKVIGGGQNTYGHSVRADVKADSITTIKNSTMSGAFRGIQSFTLNGTLLIENTTLAPQCYCLNVDGGTGKLVVNNSVLKGWTSYTNSVESATFTNCTFEVNPNSYGYNCVRAYTNTTFVNCDFGDEFWFGAANKTVTVTFENCRYKGTLITADNVSAVLEPTDNANTTVVVKSATTVVG